jgi:hypothetical protein
MVVYTVRYRYPSIFSHNNLDMGSAVSYLVIKKFYNICDDMYDLNHY